MFYAPKIIKIILLTAIYRKNNQKSGFYDRFKPEALLVIAILLFVKWWRLFVIAENNQD